MKLKTLIVEDEANSQKLLKYFLLTYCQGVEVVGMVPTVQKAKEVIHEKKPELVFLDIELADGNGFELLNQLVRKDFLLVIISGYDRFGFKAIKHGAFDYLLKPFAITEIVEVIERVKQRADNIALLQALEQKESPSLSILESNKLLIKTITGKRVIETSDIEYISVDEPYCRIYLLDNTPIMIHTTLKALVHRLPSFLFRINRSCVVNMYQIISWDKGRGGNVETSSGKLLPISYRLKKEFKEAIRRYMEQ